MAKYYKLSIKQIDDNGEVEELLDENEKDLSKVIILGLDKEEKHCCEMIFNASIADIAALIAGTKRIKIASNLSMVMLDLEKDSVSMMESALMDAIKGEIQ